MFIPYLTVALFGLVFGSFLNVCIVRLPQQESIVTPRSHCVRCSQSLRWYDNVPVVSYLLLRGRCRYCGVRISPRYLLVEILTSVLLVATFCEFGVGAEFAKDAILVMLLVVLIFTDLHERRIPHAVTLFGIAAGLLLSFIVPVDDRPLEWLLSRFDVFLAGGLSSFLGALTGAIIGGGLFYGVGEAFYRLRGVEALGFGDVMLMLMAGTFLGVPLTLLTILLGSLLGALVAGVLSATSARFRRGYHWPYGTFLGAAAIYASLGGNTLIDAYLRWSGIAQ